MITKLNIKDTFFQTLHILSIYRLAFMSHNCDGDYITANELINTINHR